MRTSGVAPSASSSSSNSMRDQRLHRRQRHQAHRRLGDDAERALRSDHQARQVDGRRRVDEGVEVVSADATQHLGEPAVDLVGVGAGQRRYLAAGAGQDRLAARSRRPAPRARAAPASPPTRRPAPRSAIARGRWSCRRAPSARRSSCWPSCRQRWRGSTNSRRGRSAGRAVSGDGSARRGRRRVRRGRRGHRDRPPASDQRYFEVSSTRPCADGLAGLRRAAAARRDRHAVAGGYRDDRGDVIGASAG